MRYFLSPSGVFPHCGSFIQSSTSFQLVGSSSNDQLHLGDLHRRSILYERSLSGGVTVEGENGHEGALQVVVVFCNVVGF